MLFDNQDERNNLTVAAAALFHAAQIAKEGIHEADMATAFKRAEKFMAEAERVYNK
jgi:hypothetical protein